MSCSVRIRSGAGGQMTLRIELVQGRIRLSGEFRFGHLDQVKTEIERCQSPIVLDLRNWISSISKVFVFSMHVRKRASRSCTVRLTSGNGCCRNEVGRKSIKNRCNGPPVGRTMVGLQKLMRAKRNERKKGE